MELKYKNMSNYIEYKDKVAFHPGYYIKELVEESGLTQEDFAKRLDTTPKNLSILVRGEQSLSIDIAMKLSRISGTTISYWLNLQKAYDALIAEFESKKELEKEKGEQEEKADKYARDMLIPNSDYIVFCDNKKYDVESIKLFAHEIDRDSGIVLGRLQNDRKVDYTNKRLNALHQKFKADLLRCFEWERSI